MYKMRWAVRKLGYLNDGVEATENVLQYWDGHEWKDVPTEPEFN